MNGKMTRRGILATLAASLVPGAARAAGKKIVVIGAGLAGLSAARALKVAGAEVIVLEARDRIGGRIWTSRAWQDLPVDLGASWIHGTEGNPMTTLADEAGARRVATTYDASVSLDENGKATDIEEAREAAEEVVNKARKAAERRDTDQSLADAIRASSDWKKADAASRRMIRHYVNGSFEQEFGGSWDESSAWHIDDGSFFDGGDVLFPDGYDQIVMHLAKGIDIRTSAVVETIAPLGDRVGITLRGDELVEADHAVVTVPLGVLREGAIDFVEPLSAARQKAIDTLRMGLLNKCWMRFDKVRWPDDVDWIEWLGPKDGVWAQWVSLAHAAKLPVLLGFNAAERAREMEKLDDRATLASAHDALKAMFGSGFPAPLAGQVTRWSQDPFCFGSYSFNAVGASPKLRRALAGAEWDGRLIFAGEATADKHFGTAHGAVISGLAAAKALA